MLAPICLFTYNRLYETKLTVEALKSNFLASESELFIFSDGPKNSEMKPMVNAVRSYIHSITGFKTISIIESIDNKGLADSIITGVNQIIKKYGKVIVLEDDLITSASFLTFLNQALDYYKQDKNIQSINGFSLLLKNVNNSGDVYFQKRPFPWGWGTWTDRWNLEIFDKKELKLLILSDSTLLKKFKKECGSDIQKMFLNSIENKNDSWYVRWVFNHFQTNRYSVYPVFSLVDNIGFTEEGTHCKNINPYKYRMLNQNKNVFSFINFIVPTKKKSISFLNYFSYRHKIYVRLNLLRSSNGRKTVFAELKTRLLKYNAKTNSK